MAGKENIKVLPHIRLTKEWIERWLPILNEREIKAYLKLATHYNVKHKKSFPGGQEISRSIGSEDVKIAYRAVKGLEEKGLIEVVKNKRRRGWANNEYRLLCVDEDGYHRAEKCQFTLKEALEEYEERINFLELVHNQHHRTEEDVLKIIGEKYPDFLKAWEKIKEDSKNPVLELDLMGYLLFSLGDKYPQLRENYPHKFDEVMGKHFQKMHDKEEAIKKELEANWERAKKDLEYCVNFIDTRPEAIKFLKNNPSSKWKELLVEKYPEVVDITMGNYGIFKELADRYELAPFEVHEIFSELILSKGKVGVVCDLDGYVSKLKLPETIGLSEEEERLLDLVVEDEYIKNLQTGRKELLRKGFTAQERKNYRRTLEKIKAAKKKYVDYILNKTTEELADLYLQGKIRKDGGDAYIPPKRYWKDTGEEEKMLVYEEGAEPEKWDLEGLLRQITYEINEHTAYYRGEDPENSLVQVSPVKLGKVKERFERHLKELKEEDGR